MLLNAAHSHVSGLQRLDPLHRSRQPLDRRDARNPLDHGRRADVVTVRASAGPQRVLTTRSTSPARMLPTVVGSPLGPIPSACLRSTVALSPLRRSTSAVPWVARISKPRSDNRLTGKIMDRLSRLATVMIARPDIGRP